MMKLITLIALLPQMGTSLMEQFYDEIDDEETFFRDSL